MKVERVEFDALEQDKSTNGTTSLMQWVYRIILVVRPFVESCVRSVTFTLNLSNRSNEKFI